MTKFHFVYKYLKALNIPIDSEEFELQVLAHPNFPSILSITDTLAFMGIQNKVYKIDISDFDKLGNNFVGLLSADINDGIFFSHIKKNDNKYFYLDRIGKSYIQIGRKEIKSYFKNVILIVEPYEQNENKSSCIILCLRKIKFNFTGRC